ncbi:hypothetical protein D3C72_580300 [compost metagenome]
MLIGLTGLPGSGQGLVADYLMRTHAFITTPSVTDDAVTEHDAGHHVLVLDVPSQIEAQEIYARGGVIVHVVDPVMPSFGPTNGIVLRALDREINAASGSFRAFDVLDALVGEAEFLSA